MRYKLVKWMAGISALLLILMLGTLFIDEPIRRYTLKQVNSRLDGYLVTVADFDFNPFNLGLLVDGLLVTRATHPEAPILELETLYFRLHWRELLAGEIVAVCELIRPRLHLNLQQLQEEHRDQRPVTDKGWQAALKEFYPLEINRLAIMDGEVVYIDNAEARPLKIAGIQIKANNIRNLRHPEQPYPSPFQAKAVLFDSGRLEVEGKANFLAAPYPGVAGNYHLRNMPLGYLKPVLAHWGIKLTAGEFNSAGRVEYSPAIHELQVRNFDISGLQVDYLHQPASPAKPSAETEAEAGEQKVPFRFLVDRLHIDGEAGFVNEFTSPAYRLYFSQAELKITGLADQFRTGEAAIEMRGKFMDSGDTLLTGTFRQVDSSPDFALMIKIVGARLPALNDLFQAYADFDVAAGSLTIYADLKVAGGRIKGFLKPFFANVDIYDDDQDKRQSLLQKMYEGFMEALANLLENEPREIATKIDLSGPLQKPEASTLQTLLYLIENAFFEAILPGFSEFTGLPAAPEPAPADR